LNATELREIPPGKKLYDHYVKGLFALGNRDGSKTFYLYYYDMAKKQRKIKLGLFGQLTLEGARRAAQMILQRVAAGENPAKERKEAKTELTVAELMLSAIKQYWGQPRYIESGTCQSIILAFKAYFQKIAKYKLSELNNQVLTRWMQSFGERHAMANHCLVYLNAAFNWAIRNDLTSLANPCEKIKRFPKQKRSRYATPQEIKQIGNYLEEVFEVDPIPAMYLYLILTTGTRPKAIERLKWDDLKIKHSLDGKQVGIISFFGKSSARTGEKETIIIPPKTMAMINRLPKISEFIVPCTMPRRLWKRIQAKFNLQDLWARDLRRTYATVGLSGGVPLSQVGELLNHKCWDTTKIYAKLMLDQRINSAMAIAKSLDQIIHR